MNENYEGSFIYDKMFQDVSSKHFRALPLIAIIQLVVELVYFFLLGGSGLLFLSPLSYFRLYVIIPTVINILSLATASYCLKTLDSGKSSWIITIESLFLLSCIYFFHNLFEILCLTFFIETSLTMVYGNKKLTTFTCIAAILSKIGIDAALKYTPLAHPYGFHLSQVYTGSGNRSDMSLFNNILFVVSMLLTLYLNITMISLENKKQLIHDMSRDSLTGLYNRKSVMEYLAQLLERNAQGALILMDLDGFKQANDKLGHPFGDKLLKDVAASIKQVFRSEDIASRLGGDEFMIVARGLPVPLAIEKCENLIAKISNTYLNNEGEQVKIGASIGVAEITANDSDSDILYNTVDKALYQAKEHGKGRVVVSQREPSP